MFEEPSQYFVFDDQHHQILQHLTINEEEPGSVLHDFGVMLDVLHSNSTILTASEQLPLESITQINERLAHPLKLALKRSQQKSYPYIQGLYLLLRASGLTYVDSSGKKPLLVFDEEVYKQWLDLNHSERFGILLDVWWLRGYGEIIREPSGSMRGLPDNFDDVMRFVNWQNLEAGLLVAGNKNVESLLKYIPHRYNLALLDLFGIITIQSGVPAPGKGWHIEHIKLTPFGGALLALLYAKAFKPDVLYGEADPLIEKEEAETLRGILKPYLPAWNYNLKMPKATPRKGAHIFKVSLGSVWRRIAIDGKQPLDKLARAIISAVGFDNDHLYAFSYPNRFGALTEIHHPHMQEQFSTTDVLVHNVPLKIGQSMTFLFDFGDSWEFDVVLEAVDSDTVIKTAKILETNGKSPEQYPDSEWDEDIDIDL